MKLQVLVDNGKPNTNPIGSLRDGLKALFELIPDGVETSMYAIAGAPRPIVKATMERQKLIDGIGLIAPDSGARYENINSTTRLATLLPEFGKKIADSNARQSHQYRVTYERPANAKEQPRIGLGVKREGTASISIDGHLP